jgi:hypothetical protein
LNQLVQQQPTESEAIIRCEGLQRRYEMGGGYIDALRRIDLDVVPNEYLDQRS